jgi:hypothetical protein
MTTPEFDLRPDPRILPMLGEINLAQWRCLAELVDNSVDGFLSIIREGGAPADPEVSISLPMRDDASARVTVSDNGPGMTPERLEMAVRAGWSGNNPVDSLGMFGMGFNIATARLGTVTTVWTSGKGDAEEHGLRIDFDELRSQRHFRTPRLARPKTDPAASGTSITIERLKPDQRAWFTKPGNRAAVKQELAKAYSAMLRASGVPMTFKLVLNGKRVPATYHCVWNDDRSVETTRHGTVYAIQKIDRRLPDRPFCTACWQWLAGTDVVCPACGAATSVVKRKRHVHGWIGLQRYLSPTDYGVDFVRNGRKIEIGNRDLFYWRDPDSGAPELEYPIDDPRQRGRFVGEIHLDHSRVTYMKDRFDRTDPAWDEMVGIVRGDGPLQPQTAAHLGFGGNESPLFKLYQAFRRSSPRNARVAGGWANVLVVKENDLAVEMAKKFEEGVAEYQTDQKWWELVEAEDARLLTGGTSPGPAAPASPGGAGLPGFAAPTPGAGASPGPGGTPGPRPAAPPPPVRAPLLPLTREYRHDGTSLRWDVRAYDVEESDPDLGGAGRPWSFRRQNDGTNEFLVNSTHPVFRSATMTPLDGLLSELAYRAADFVRNQTSGPPFCEVLGDLRDRYGGAMKLDPVALLNSTEMLFRAIARAWPRAGIDASDATRLFGELTSSDREAIHHRMATRSVPNPQLVISEGRFLEYAPPRVIVAFILAHPDLFFDGRCWEDSYAALDYMLPAATETARSRVLQHHEALLSDALWLSEQDAADLEVVPRDRILRAMLAVELLAPTPAEVADDGG